MKPLRKLYWHLVQEAYAASNRYDFVTAWVLAEEARLVFEREDDCTAEPLASLLLFGHLQSNFNVTTVGVQGALKSGAVVNWPAWFQPETQDEGATAVTVH